MSAESTFHNKLRVRVCGLLVVQDAILLAQVHSPVTDSPVWSPPGGGLQFGEHMETCLEREFSEETNVEIAVRELLHINELVEPPFHAVEFYFEVKKLSGEPKIGRDPELSWDHQLIRDLKWMPVDELNDIEFAPPNLRPKLLDWDNRSSAPIFKEK